MSLFVTSLYLQQPITYFHAQFYILLFLTTFKTNWL